MDVSVAKRLAEIRDRLDDVASGSPVTLEEVRSRIQALRTDVTALQGATSDHETRLLALEALLLP